MASPHPEPEVRRLVAKAEAWSSDLSSFAFVSVVWQVGDQYFCSRFAERERFFNASIHLDTLEGLPILKEDIAVPVAEYVKYARAPTPLSPDVYVKRPCLLGYSEEKSDISAIMRHELEVLEVLKRHPHPGIVGYHGYVVEDDWIVGLGLKKYQQTLSSARREGKAIVADQVMKELEEAVQHLHSVGYVHVGRSSSVQAIADIGGHRMTSTRPISCSTMLAGLS